ncbi:MAG: DUF3592 domain-containing protein [Planctomycetota bacterium]
MNVTRKGAGCLTLFGLPFAGIGLYMAWSLVATVGEYYDARSWVAAPAAIESTAIERRSGDGGDSYEVVAAYRYEYGGKQYRGDRVGFATGMQGERYNRAKHRQLKKLRESGEPATCYVDPDDPRRAVLDRGLRPTVVLFYLPFVICFGLFGIGLIGGAWYGAFREAKLTRLRAQHADEPWRVRDDWAAGEISSRGPAALAMPIAMAVFWNGLSMPVFAMVCLNGEEAWVVALVSLFPLIGLGLIASPLVGLWRWLRYGRSTLRLAKTPGVVGGELAGVVLAPPGLPAEAEYRVRLACLRTVVGSDSDGDETTTLQTDWEDERVVERTLADPSGKRGVPIRFVIPSDAKPTDDGLWEKGLDLPILWRLTVKSQSAGLNHKANGYEAEFDVPVFLTEESQDGVEADSAPLTEYEREETLAELLALEGIRFTDLGDGFELVCPAGRSLASAAISGAIGLVFLGVAVGMGLYLDAWGKWILVPAFGLFGVLLTGLGLDLLLYACHLRVAGDDWTLRTGWVGLRGAGATFGKDEVRGFSRKQGMTSTSSAGPSKKWNHVRVRLVGGREKTVVRNIASRRAERALIAELRRWAGIADKS